VVAGAEGFGHHGRIHSARFFELADQPMAIIMAVTEEEADRFMNHLREAAVTIFYVRTPIEFGTLGGEA
jgi:PII-like signaling protein